MNKILLILLTAFLLPNLANSQSLKLLKEDKTPIENDTLNAFGTLSDEELKVHVYVENLASVDKDVWVKLYVKQLVDGAVMQYCWNSCFDIATNQSTAFLTIPANEIKKDFYCSYIPKNLSGITEIMYTFFVNKDETDSASVTIKYEVVDGTTGIENLNDLKKNIKCYPNPATSKVYFDFETENSYPKTIKIFDIVGNKIKQIELNDLSSTKEVDIQDLKSGMYLWTFEINGVPIKSDRLIKK
jgi:hypothetical protein